MTRAEHLAWAKKRAISAYDFSKKAEDAIASIASDLGKHPETQRSAGMAAQLGLGLFMARSLETRQQIVNFINGFN